MLWFYVSIKVSKLLEVVTTNVPYNAFLDTFFKKIITLFPFYLFVVPRFLKCSFSPKKAKYEAFSPKKAKYGAKKDTGIYDQK